MFSGGLRTKGITKQSQVGKPLITVVTVVRNGEKTLEETILSVINQTYNNVEYIIIDGASTDGTLDIIKKYEDRIDYWMSEPDDGIYYAMNKGIDLATGEWINFMNSEDEFYSNDTIEKFISLYDNYSNIVYGNSQRFYKEGIYIDRSIQPALNYMPNCHQSFFVRTYLLKEKHFDINYTICADANFFRNMYLSGYKYQHLPVIICNYENSKGYSSMNNKLYFVEIADIEGINKTFQWKVKYLLFLIKMQIKKIIPPQLIEMRIKRNMNRYFSKLL